MQPQQLFRPQVHDRQRSTTQNLRPTQAHHPQLTRCQRTRLIDGVAERVRRVCGHDQRLVTRTGEGHRQAGGAAGLADTACGGLRNDGKLGSVRVVKFAVATRQAGLSRLVALPPSPARQQQ